MSLPDLIQQKKWEHICCMPYPFTPKDVDRVMEAYMADEGIESGNAYFKSEVWDNEFEYIGGFWANTGDEYAITLTFDVMRRRFVFQSESDLAIEVLRNDRLATPQNKEYSVNKLLDKIDDMESDYNSLVDQIREKEWAIQTGQITDLESVRLWMEDFVWHNEGLYA